MVVAQFEMSSLFFCKCTGCGISSLFGAIMFKISILCIHQQPMLIAIFGKPKRLITDIDSIKTSLQFRLSTSLAIKIIQLLLLTEKIRVICSILSTRCLNHCSPCKQTGGWRGKRFQYCHIGCMKLSDKKYTWAFKHIWTQSFGQMCFRSPECSIVWLGFHILEMKKVLDY